MAKKYLGVADRTLASHLKYRKSTAAQMAATAARPEIRMPKEARSWVMPLVLAAADTCLHQVLKVLIVSGFISKSCFQRYTKKLF
jgi:hypothetical protein